MTDWGSISLGRFTLREIVAGAEAVNASDGARSVSLSGQESSPPLTVSQVRLKHESVLGAFGSLAAVTFTDKDELDGYYAVRDANATVTDHQGEVVKTDWSITLARIGSEAEVDLESRLAGTVRANDFSLPGERWHAPPPGAYAYYTGATQPAVMTRASEDGAITVYRAIPVDVAPRWGCAPADYPGGRVRVLSESSERTGINIAAAAAAWELSNALVRVRPSGSSLEVAAHDGAGWEAKLWNLTAAGSAISSWAAATILRNDFEQAVLRLTSTRAPGRVTLDLTLRRGARFVEGYVQADTSGTISIALAALENTTSFASAGYVVATSNDTAGNKYTAGSARNFTVHASGGITKTAATTLDFYLGAVVNGTGAASGDTAVDLRNQYIGSLAEATAGVRR